MIAARLKKFLDAHRVGYQELWHSTASSFQHIAQALNLPIHQCVRTLGLIDEKGLVIALIPLTASLDLAQLNHSLMRNFKMLSPLALDKLFYDCDPGVHPALAEPYGLTMLIDKAFQHV